MLVAKEEDGGTSVWRAGNGYHGRIATLGYDQLMFTKMDSESYFENMHVLDVECGLAADTYRWRWWKLHKVFTSCMVGAVRRTAVYPCLVLYTRALREHKAPTEASDIPATQDHKYICSQKCALAWRTCVYHHDNIKW